MAPFDIKKFMAGFRKFREKYFEESSLFQTLASGVGQTPKTLLIGCSDSRVDPALLTSAAPGDLFVVRNVANIVPPFDPSGGVHGISAAIEFAVGNLKVENIIILGHRQCGGIRALMENHSIPSTFVERWMSIARPAKEKVLREFAKADLDTQCRQAERESIVTSIENLKTFPFVAEAIKDCKLSVLGIYFDLESGSLFQYDESSSQFQVIE